MHDLDEVIAGIARHRAMHPSVWRMRQKLAALRRFMEETIDG